jgi:hypothetical protein|tara:strand:- start:99 stop:332 length:234 start_codon:yes stop_codon:yes gene_type:complete
MRKKTDKEADQYDPCKHEWGTDASVRRAKKLTPKETGMKSFKEFTEATYQGKKVTLNSPSAGRAKRGTVRGNYKGNP